MSSQRRHRPPRATRRRSRSRSGPWYARVDPPTRPARRATWCRPRRPMRMPRLLGKRPRTSFWWLTPSRKPRRQPAAERLRQVEFLAAGQVEVALRERRVDGLAVGLRRRGDVRAALEPALDLERDHARRRSAASIRSYAARSCGLSRYARSPRSRARAVHDHLVGQPAGLGALAAVGAAAAERLARQALAAVRDAQRPVDEHLHRHVGRGGHLADVVERQLAGQDDPLDAEPRARRRCPAARSASSACRRGRQRRGDAGGSAGPGRGPAR